MPKYMITADIPASVYQVVEASDRDQAFDKALNLADWKLSDNALQPDGASEYTVEEIEEEIEEETDHRAGMQKGDLNSEVLDAIGPAARATEVK